MYEHSTQTKNTSADQLERFGLGIEYIDLCDLNETFAVQVIHCHSQLRVSHKKFNVYGGAISIGHPEGISGARMVGHAFIKSRRQGVRYVVITMCIVGGAGAISVGVAD